MAELANLYFSVGDLREMMKGLFLTLTNLVSIIKFYTIWKNQNSLLNLTAKINRKEFQPKSEKQKKFLRKYVKLSKMMSIGLYAGCTMTCSFWGVYPYTDENGPFLPIAAYIPINTTDSTTFGFVYAYEIIATLIGGYTDLSSDCLIASLIMVVCGQLNILNDSLVNITKMANQELKEIGCYNTRHMQKKQQIINQKLKECVKHHKAILEFAEEITSLFATSLFFQFLVSVFVFCATFFEMTMVRVTSVRFFSMALYQYCMLLEIFPSCYFGNEVILESRKLTSSAYHSDWLNYNVKVRKNLIFFMTRTQKITKITAGGFFTLSLDTFIKILKSSWSYVAVLIQVQNKQNK
ncbi:odorant receptor Or1-like [Diabrotica virgifera virgifera]|uniref:Odorant receptor n=1 Tax=Diabrotica virgifera virgifera TaxID=50390 RepID=A0ABM5JML0_DIAVI|nr:odorant receptor Or1-like [Diabrotica virgifera virgifera]